MRTKKLKTTVRLFKVLSKLSLAVGLFIFLIKASITILILGGILYSIYLILNGFVTVRETPKWEVVYPELALNNND